MFHVLLIRSLCIYGKWNTIWFMMWQKYCIFGYLIVAIIEPIFRSALVWATKIYTYKNNKHRIQHSFCWTFDFHIILFGIYFNCFANAEDYHFDNPIIGWEITAQCCTEKNNGIMPNVWLWQWKIAHRKISLSESICLGIKNVYENLTFVIDILCAQP